MERVGLYQLAAAIILFQVGSSPLFLLASEAKQDAWLAVAVAMVVGLALLFFVTLRIQELEPDQNLVEILQSYLGKYAGLALSWAYVIYFLYKSVRNVREFGDLMIEYLLPASPLFAVTGILMLVSSYAVFKGVEVFFRVAGLMLPFTAAVYLLVVMLLQVVGIIQTNQLLPMLAEGIKPVLSAALPEVISFPFGEMVLFLMFWKYVHDQKQLKKTTVIAYCVSGSFLIFTNALIICILSAPLAALGGIPLMLAASMVQLAQVVERMDPFLAIMLFIGVLFKQTAYYLGAVVALGTIFRVRYRVMILPAGAAIYTGSLLFKSLMQQIWFGFEYNVKYHFPIFQIILPLILLLLMKWKKTRLAGKSGGVHHGNPKEKRESAASGAAGNR